LNSNALVPLLPQGVAVSSAPQLYPAGRKEPACSLEICSLVARDAVSFDQKADLFFFGEREAFTRRRFKGTYLPPPVDRNWRGYKQEPSTIRSNLRFSGTYGMEGSVLASVTEKGIYIDFFS
jgi:hypothetical protein